ncbi:carboxypeptidase-like regulatory domain-containing protein, partial [Nostoc sp. CHAB 5834]|nr:carboxypeptidase-like regulatory domain-containing protein [Nostoc sp. CHAB 5834]
MNRWLIISWLTIGLLSGLATLTAAQTTTLTGVVIDAATGQLMPFANVYLNGSTRGTLTSENGQYKLTGVPLGTVEVVASFVG